MDNSHPDKVDPASLTHICDLCGKVFSSGESLCIHQVASHKNKKDDKSPSSKSSPVKRNKSGGIKTEDGGEEEETNGESVCCPICGRQFANKSYLKVRGAAQKRGWNWVDSFGQLW